MAMTGNLQHASPNLDAAVLDTAVGNLGAGLTGWVGLPLPERLELLRGVRRRLGDQAAGIVAASAEAQGLPRYSHWQGDLWFGLTTWAYQIWGLESVLGRVAAGRGLVNPGMVHVRSDGQVVVDVFPANLWHRLFHTGVSSRVWLQPGVSAERAVNEAGAAYQDDGFDDPGVALLLAAGDVASLPGMDAVHLLFQRGCVVVMKLNPVNAYLRPYLERVFVELIDAGWLQIVDGGADVGRYLAHHPGVDRIHMTGSAATYDALVWGVGPQAEENRAAGTRLLVKPFTAELGGVNPMIVVPGHWTRHDLRRQADLIVGTRLFNCGHACSSTQILVLPEGWSQADTLMDDIRDFLGHLEPQAPYYPGTEAKVRRALAGAHHIEVLDEPDRRFLVTDLDPDSHCSLFRDEVFADVLGVVTLPAPDVDTYLGGAARFANEVLAGSLCATILIDPATATKHAGALDRAIAGLRFGAIGVNDWAGLAFGLGYPTWGAFPGHTPQDIGSGMGVVGNANALPDPQKSVLSAWFRTPAKPPACSSHRTLPAICEGIVSWWAEDGNPRRVPGIALAALRA